MLKLSRTLMVLLLSLTFVGFITADLLAEEVASATKKVRVRVLPNIGVGASTPEPVEVQTGKFQIRVPFRIAANSQFVKIQIAATKLYKADDPASPTPPIDVFTDRPAFVLPANGNESGGSGDNKLAWVREITLDDREGYETEVGTFESSQPGIFNQDVDVIVTWIQANNDQPVGDYVGLVKMTAMIM